MTKTVVITRAKGDETTLTEALQERGLRTIHEALTEIFLNHTVRHELEEAVLREPDAVIATSRHGVRALATLTDLRDAPVLCVGEATCDTALSAGFTRAVLAGGTVDDLLAYLADAYDSDARFLYVSAKHVRHDLEQLLQGYGMQVQRVVAYEAVAAEALSDTLAEQLKRGQIDAATFLSRRSAETFIKLLAKTGSRDALPGLTAFALSETIAEPLRALPWQSVHVAAKPTLASLADCVDNTLNA